MVLFSHIGLDYFGADTHPPSKGIMIFFPFSTDFYASPISIFPSVDASKEGSLLLLDVLIVLGIEFVLLGGILLGLIKIKSRWLTLRYSGKDQSTCFQKLLAWWTKLQPGIIIMVQIGIIRINKILYLIMLS